MAEYEIDDEWSDLIPVAAGNYVQMTRGSRVYISAASTNMDANCILLRVEKAIEIRSATSIRARTRSGEGRIQVVTGL